MMDSKNDDLAIKLIGIGSCGVHTINYMIQQGLKGVDYFAIDTDANTLNNSLQHTQFKTKIKGQIRGAHILFITAGVSSRTGTGLASIIAQIAMGMDIVTVALMITTLASEEEHGHYECKGLKELHDHVDALIILKNDRLIRDFDSEFASPEVFATVNDLIYRTVSSIADAINMGSSGISSALSESGMTLTGSAVASGPDRARVAATRAVENMGMAGARGGLLFITSASLLTIKEFLVASRCVSHASEHAIFIVNFVTDETMGDDLRVTVLATGLSVPQACDYSLRDYSLKSDSDFSGMSQLVTSSGPPSKDRVPSTLTIFCKKSRK
jgi:cell division protein FtsZ